MHVFRATATGLLLLLAGCSDEPTSPIGRNAGVTVVAGGGVPAGRDASRHQLAMVSPAPAATPARRPSVPTLTVEESAKINTSEMWSEPIR